MGILLIGFYLCLGTGPSSDQTIGSEDSVPLGDQTIGSEDSVPLGDQTEISSDQNPVVTDESTSPPPKSQPSAFTAESYLAKAPKRKGCKSSQASKDFHVSP